MKSRGLSIRRFMCVLVALLCGAVSSPAFARKFVDDEVGFTIDVPYAYRAFTKNLPAGERFWEFESVLSAKDGARTAGDQRAVIRVARTTERDPLKLLLAYERGGMKDRMPTHKVIAPARLDKTRGPTEVAVASYEGLRPLGGSAHYRFVFRVSVEIRRGQACFKILEVRAAGVPDDVVTKRVAEVQSILDTVVIK